MTPDEVVLHKDVVIALLGASATIAGLVLVFLGLVVSAYDALGTAVPPGAKSLCSSRRGCCETSLFRLGEIAQRRANR
jgi:hypothetical protein